MPNENVIILLIDDDHDDWDIFDLAVKEIDNTIKVEHAGYCEDAIKRLSERHVHPNFIFLDLNMPKMQGSECLIHLKQMDHLNNVPVVIYSTSRRPQEKSDLLAKGASHYISKTNTFDELVSQIKGFIEN